MSAQDVVPVEIAGSVTVIGLCRALATEGLVIRHDSARKVIVIEPVREKREASPP